jgi:hypothetical protein
MARLANLAYRMGRAGFTVLVVAWSAVLGVCRAVSSGTILLYDFVRSRLAMRGGQLRCPKGHQLLTEGETYCCGSCGFTYGGASASIWFCGNPECPAPITEYINCPDCGLSRRNPYRWGRP